MQTRIDDASVTFYEQPLVRPLKLSAGTIHTITEARAEVTVTVDDRRATGFGSIYLSHLWAWPGPPSDVARKQAALQQLCQQIAADLPRLCGGAAHPLQLGMRLHKSICSETMPPVLARAMCLSPFDAAIHDAAGIATNRSAFAFYDDGLLADGELGQSIRSLMRPSPATQLDAWWVVSTDDDLVPLIAERGYRCFKLKTLGRSAQDDAQRTAKVYRAVMAMGVADPLLVVDSNEAHDGAEAVLEYLHALRDCDADAYAALQYLEQPTARDIEKSPQDWHAVTKLKPVMLDEGLTDLRLLATAKAQGWLGLALKTCKGHSFALVAAAWAMQHGMLLSMQDLTNPGFAAVHNALFAAYVPTINGVEINSPQFTPAANESLAAHYRDLFEPRDGVHRINFAGACGLATKGTS
jgi:L-alanine-DL-glutamate epimerase-like enolase superfamily enzyme